MSYDHRNDKYESKSREQADDEMESVLEKSRATRQRLINDAETNWIKQGAAASGLIDTEPEPVETPDFFDPVERPKHYAGKDPEPIDVIEAWNLGFNLGSAVKYIARCEDKGSPIEDLRKASWYLQREIERRQREL